MDLSKVADFLALARALNFSRAAEARNMTQPAFSRRIRALEAEVGARLITRTTRSVTLTEAGRAFLPRAEALLRMAEEARSEALAAAGLAQRSLTLAATHALSYTFVPRWLMDRLGPEALGTLNLVSDSFEACHHLLAQGKAHFMIAHRGLDQTEASRAQVIGRDALVPFSAPDGQGAPLWTAGPGAPLLAYAPASGLHALMRDVPGKVQLRSMLAATNLELARSGQGIAWLPLSLAQSAVAEGALVRADPQAEIPMQIVLMRSGHRLSPHCEAIWRRLQETH